jgi:uncharacterized protein
MSEQLPISQLRRSPELEPHFAGLDEGRVVIPRCDECGEAIWYPRAFCPTCGSSSVSWVEASGEGEIYSFSVVRKGTGDWAEHAPYVVAYVELDEGPRVLTNVVAPWEGIEVGSRVQATVEKDADGTPILRFALAG